MADPRILEMSESEFRRRFGDNPIEYQDPATAQALPPSSVSSMPAAAAAAASPNAPQPIIIDMPESEFRARYGSMFDNAVQGIKDIPSNIASLPKGLYDTATGTAGAIKALATGGEAMPNDKMALRNAASMGGGMAGALAGAEMAAPAWALGPVVGGGATLLGGALGGGLGLLGVDWLAEKAGVDAPRTAQERLNSLAYNTAQGLGTDLAFRGAGKVAGDITKPFKQIATTAGRETAAANVLSDIYGPNAIGKIDQAQQALKGDTFAANRPTAELLGNEGSAQLQKQLEQEGFGSVVGQKNIDREVARRGALENLAPAEARIEDVQQAVTDNIDNLKYASRGIDSTLPKNIDPMNSGDQIRAIAEQLAGKSREGVQSAFGNVPQMNVERFAPTADLNSAAARMADYFGPGSEGAPKELQRMVETLNPELKPVPQVDATTRLLQEARGTAPAPQSSKLSLDYLQRLRRWAGESATKSFNFGENRAGSVAQAVKNNIDDMLENAVKDGTMPADQAASYKAALKSHSDMVNTFELGPTGRILRRGQGSTGYALEPSSVGRQFWAADTEAMQNFQKALGGDVNARELLSRDAMTNFRDAATNSNGEFVPNKIKEWTTNHQAFLDAFPEIRSSLDDMWKAEAGAQLREKNFGKFAESNPEQAAGVLMSGPRSTENLKMLKRQIGQNPDLIQGLRRGVVDDLVNRVYNMADLKAKPNSYKRYLEKNSSFMSELFTPDQVKVLGELYGDLSSEARLEDMAKRASSGQSVTSQKNSLAVALRDKIQQEFGIAAKVMNAAPAIGGTAGAVAGGGAGGLIKGVSIGGAVGGYIGTKVASLSKRAENAAIATLAKAAADPDFAKLLLSKATPENMRGAMKILTPKLSPIRSMLVTGALLSRIDTAKAAQSLGKMLTMPSSNEQPAAPVRDLASLLVQNKPQPVVQGTPTPKIDSSADFVSSGDTSVDRPAVDSKLIDAMAMQESTNRADAVGPKTRFGTAKGRLQLLDATGEEMHKKLGLSGKYDPFNAEQNTQIGQAYMGELADRYKGSVPLALAAYNWGMGNLDKAINRLASRSSGRVVAEFNRLSDQAEQGGLSTSEAKRAAAAALVSNYGVGVLDDYLPAETQNYVRKILSRYSKSRSVEA